ncbi:MAG: trypsin-like peptidase domain-containing protein [Holosporaceae bacterium]|jgi:serine protease Do|nr:trypsin-like peptidase domain-containing protein [Holosporaceae bacterium]
MRCLAVLLLLSCHCSSAFSASFRNGVKNVIKSVVDVIVVYKNEAGGDEPANGIDATRNFPHCADDFPKEPSDGTGIIIDESGYVITNSHVLGMRQKIRDGSLEKIKVILPNNAEYEAKIIGIDYRTDIVLLKINSKTPLQSAKFADSDAVEVGDNVFAIGSPYVYSKTVTAGIISYKGRDLSDQIAELGSGGDLVPYIQTDAVVNQGNSGGPLCLSNGEVVGMIAVVLYDGIRSTGISFAIPSKTIQEVVDQLRRTGSIKRSWLGISSVSPVSREVSQTLGLGNRVGFAIQRLDSHSPAADAGLQCDDILLSIANQTFSEDTSLKRIVNELHIGTVLPILVARNGVEIKLSITVGAKNDDEKTELISDETFVKKDVLYEKIDSITLGVSDLTAEIRKSFNIPADMKGVLVARSDDPRSNIFVGNVILKVNYVDIDSVKELRAELQKAMNARIETVAFYVYDSQMKKFFVPIKLQYATPKSKKVEKAAVATSVIKSLIQMS